METIKINIDHSNNNYKTLIVSVDENLTVNDANTFFIMFENFIDNCHKKQIKFAWLLDMKNISIKTLKLSYFEQLTKLCKRKYDIFLNLLVCSVIITNSQIFNNFFTLFKSLYTPVRPILNTESLENANIFIDECFNNKHKSNSILY